MGDNKRGAISNKQSAINSRQYLGKDLVLEKADRYAHLVYATSRRLPKDELYGLTSQLRRAALSVPLNAVEGYARQSSKSERNFLIIAHASLKESQYLLGFALEEGYLDNQDLMEARSCGEEVAKLIWSKSKTLEKRQ